MHSHKRKKLIDYLNNSEPFFLEVANNPESVATDLGMARLTLDFIRSWRDALLKEEDAERKYTYRGTSDESTRLGAESNESGN